MRHVLVVVVGLAVGFIVVYMMLREARQEGWNQGYEQGIHDETLLLHASECSMNGRTWRARADGVCYAADGGFPGAVYPYHR